ncbi:MAG: hypothetical protein AAF206_00410 [Bacteroidota bacterium]
METLNNGRASIKQHFDGLEITIPSPKHWFALIFGTLWLGGWVMGLTTVGRHFSFQEILSGAEGSADWFMLIWLLFWTISGLTVIGLLLWGYFGKESLLLQNSQVVFRRHIFGIGMTKVFDKFSLKDFRFNPVVIGRWSRRSRYAMWGIGTGKIKFDYGMKTYSLGLGLDDAEAKHIATLLAEKVRSLTT